MKGIFDPFVQWQLEQKKKDFLIRNALWNYTVGHIYQLEKQLLRCAMVL